jgi:hypothetical protein
VKVQRESDRMIRGSSRSVAYWLLIGLLVAALFYFFVLDHGFRFTEEVQLANGEVIEVERAVKAKSFAEIGGPGGWEPVYMSLAIGKPKRANNPPKWETTAGLVPILFDRDPDNGEWALLATFYTCEAWYDLGRPKLPYAEFRVRNARWQRVELSSKWIGRSANILTGISSKGEPKFLPLAEKDSRNFEPTAAPKYKKIVDRWHTNC